MASRFKRSVPVTVNDVLEGHVALDLESLDFGAARPCAWPRSAGLHVNLV